MFDFLRAHQLDLMLVLSGISGIITFFALISNNLNKIRKFSLAALEFGATLLVTFDRLAYLYRGDVSTTGYYMVRISNFMTFFMILFTLLAYNFYLGDLLMTDAKLKKVPLRLKLCLGMLLTSVVLLIISQFNGMYYTFDEQNQYQRAPGYVFCLLLPLLAILVQLTLVIQYRRVFRPGILISLLLFSCLPLVASTAQLFLYGLSLNNLTVVAMGILLYVFSLLDMNAMMELIHKQQLEYLKEQEESMSRLFRQTAQVMAGAIDESKNHSKGHSERVAKYAGEIAKRSGMNEEECQKVYFTALLHDVGKMKIPDAVLEKEGEKTAEETAVLQSHTLEGEQILAGITEYPYLSAGAHYHHERYDGGGYPEGLKGKNIPEYARIIAVADQYDVMTSYRNGREPLPQTRVREEFVKESGILFDPDFSQKMLEMIDDDPDYLLRDQGEIREDLRTKDQECGVYRTSVTGGIAVTEEVLSVRVEYTPVKAGNGADKAGQFSGFALILFDSLDGQVHHTEKSIVENSYIEYGEIWADGHSICTRARRLQCETYEESSENQRGHHSRLGHSTEYEIRMGRFHDHLRIRISDGSHVVEAIAALPDNTHYTYVGLTGENCRLTGIRISATGETYGEGDIPRIADEINYIDRMESDLKNVQVDGYRSASSEPVPVEDGMRLVFHTMSLPSAHLVWHCPYLLLFTAKDGVVGGEGYRELVLLRLDGEIAEEDETTENKMVVSKNEDFEGWDHWKKRNRQGIECSVRFRRKGSRVIMTTENLGISVKNTTVATRDTEKIYVALTGDHCAITDIRVL